MLEAHEFTVGCLGEATPLTLVLPLDSGHGTSFLVGSSEGEAVAVFLDGAYRYQAFKTAGNDSWDGLLIPDVRIEVDEKSAFDPNVQLPVLGAVVRKGSDFVLNTRAEHWYGRVWPITLVGGADAAARIAAGFSRWNVVLGQGSEKRVLFEASVMESSPEDGN